MFFRELTSRISSDRGFDHSAAHPLVGIRVAEKHLGYVGILDPGRDACHRSKLHDVGGFLVDRRRYPQVPTAVVHPLPNLEGRGKRQALRRDVICMREQRHIERLDRAPWCVNAQTKISQRRFTCVIHRRNDT
jgi:hypothetical protein